MGIDQKLIFDGRFINTEEAVIPAVSRGLMYGDGCFETLRSYHGNFLHLEKHLQRFSQGAIFLGFKLPDFFLGDQLKSSIVKLLQENELLEKDAVIRFQLWRKGGRGYDVVEPSPAHFTVTASALPTVKDSVTLAFVDTRRIPEASLPSEYKLSNNINYITAAREASGKEADDALMLTIGDYISETTIANLFWTKDDIIYTPSEDCDLLPGITRNVLINICRKIGFNVKEGKYTPREIMDAEAVWMCNSVREIVSVSQIEQEAFETNHPIVKSLGKEFEGYKKQRLN